jgi:GGDEF domain-containing protein
MVRATSERVLLIGDKDRQIQGALAQALPGAQVTPVASFFEAIAELSAGTFTSVLAAAEPIERRPEAAVQTLRQLAGDGRVLLFGHPTLEPLSRKMLSFGADDYLITPTSATELQQVFGAPPLRLATGDARREHGNGDGGAAVAAGAKEVGPTVTSPPTKLSLLSGLPMAEILLEAALQHPHLAAANAVKRLDTAVGPTMQLRYLRPGQAVPAAPEGSVSLSHAVRVGAEDVATLHLTMPRDEEESAARHFLSQLAHLVGKVASLDDRHARLQKLAITDDLTGLYNGRYFRHFLARIVEKARALRFPVTLLLFDIDNFKKYNDLYGHGVGDEILRQTAALMRRCCREHDLVARISGDEFAVVFWEKEGPRQPRDGKSAPPGAGGRVPQTPVQIFERFRRLISSPEFGNLGGTGKGTLTISGGLAVYPYDAHDVDGLIDAADRALMFGAKQGGKNSIYLVGEQDAQGELND